MKNEIQEFVNDNLGLKVRCIQNEDGSISMNVEDTAIGFGWIREKNGKIYIMWDRFNNFCEELGFPHKCGKDDFIPESIFYLLGMKASNDIARKFQMWLATEVISNVCDCYNIRKLKEKVILDRTTFEKRISGGIRAAQTKEIASLRGDINE